MPRASRFAAMKLADTDPLTGLQKRRDFESVAESGIRTQRRSGEAFPPSLLNIDNFNGANDAAGHHVGDRTLTCLAAFLREQARGIDTVARLGGDEFANLMPNAGALQFRAPCRHLRKTVAGQIRAAGFDTTASISCSVFMRAPKAVAQALAAADNTLYLAKSGGKNCSVVC